jgi:acyl-CoA synthetase (AMP-forming)/AMP-acid ligase II
MAGGCATLLNGWWTGEELAGGIELAGCTITLVDAQRGERLNGQSYPGKLVTFQHDCPWQEGLTELLAHGGGADTPLPELGGDDLATILYTSGSTGQSKGAYSDHRGVVQATMNYAAQTLMVFTYLGSKGEAPSSQPCSLVNVPLFHVTGEVPLFLQSFAIGRKLVLMPKWDAEEAMRLIEAEKVSYFVGVPLMSFEIASHPNRHKYDLSSCTAFAAGGAPRPVDHVKKIREELPNAFPLLGYGLTETWPSPARPARPQSLWSRSASSTMPAPAFRLARLAKWRSVRSATSWAIGTTPRRPRRQSCPTASSALATWATLMRMAICSSSTARRTSSSAAVRTSAASRWSRQSTPTPRSPKPAYLACPTSALANCQPGYSWSRTANS